MNIIIVGDSWGVGEWTDGQKTHSGLEQYLCDAGHSVINLSAGGQGNLSAIDCLSAGLKKHNNVDRVFWFQTDPMREILITEQDIPQGTKMPDIDGFNLYFLHHVIPVKPGLKLTVGGTIHNSKVYFRVKEDHVVGNELDATKFYILPYRRFSDSAHNHGSGYRTESWNIKAGLERSNLQDLTDASKIVSQNIEFLRQAYKYANSLGRKIHCIGGLSKLKLDLIANYSNLIPAIPSVLEMIYPEYQHADIVSANSNWRQELMSVVRLDRDSVDYFYQQYTLEQVMIERCQEYFWPDGTHPNRKGHLKIYERLVELGIV